MVDHRISDDIISEKILCMLNGLSAIFFMDEEITTTEFWRDDCLYDAMTRTAWMSAAISGWTL